METYNFNLLTIEIDEDEESIIVFFKGKSTERNPSELISPVLMEILNKSTSTEKRIVMDFRGLEYMNSSTVTPISKIIEKGKTGPNRILIYYRKSKKWQELCFSAMRIFETKDKRIEIIGN